MDWKSIKSELPTPDTEVLVKMHDPRILGQYVVAELRSEGEMWVVGRNNLNASYIGVGNNSLAFDQWSYIDC
jgi:hypothetical protein